MEKNPYEIDFEEYIRHTDASKKDKTLAWSTAIGLQQVDGLKPSSYLYETAKKNIEGELSFDEAKNNPALQAQVVRESNRFEDRENDMFHHKDYNDRDER